MLQRRLRWTGLARSDEILLRSLLRLIAGHTREPWDIAGDGAQADLLIAGAEAAVADASAAGVLVARVTNGEADASNLALPHPFRARALIVLLDDASLRLREGAPRSPPVIVHDGPTLAEHVHRLQDTATPLWIRFDVGGSVLLHVHAGLGAFVAEDAGAVVSAAARRDVVAVVEADADALAQATAEPLAPLMWSMGLACRGFLLPLAEGARIAVTRWPDFPRLAHGPQHMRMMARIARAPATAAELAAATGTSVEDAHGFLNALLLSRCAHATAAGGAARREADVQRALPAVTTRASRNLFDRIRARLGLS
jgi:hypothetical protein